MNAKEAYMIKTASQEKDAGLLDSAALLSQAPKLLAGKLSRKVKAASDAVRSEGKWKGFLSRDKKAITHVSAKPSLTGEATKSTTTVAPKLDLSSRKSIPASVTPSTTAPVAPYALNKPTLTAAAPAQTAAAPAAAPVVTKQPTKTEKANRESKMAPVGHFSRNAGKYIAGGATAGAIGVGSLFNPQKNEKAIV